MSFDASPLIKWMETNRNNPLKDIDLGSDVRTLYGRDLAEIVGSPEFVNSHMALADTILSDNLAREGVERRDEVVLAFKLLNLLKRAKDDASAMRSEEKLGSFITHSIVVLPKLSNLRDVKPTTRVESKRQDTGEAKHDEPIQEVNRLKARLKELEIAHRELSRLASDESAIFRPKRDTALLAKIASMERRISELSLRSKSGETMEHGEGHEASEDLVDTFSEVDARRTYNEFVLSLNAVARLSETSQKVLRDLNLWKPKRINPLMAEELIEDEISYINSLLPSEQTLTKLMMFGGVLLDQAKFKKALGWMGRRDIDVLPPPLISKYYLAVISKPVSATC